MEQIRSFTGSTSWRVLGLNGVLYASLAALYTAGTKPFPFLGPPMVQPESIELSVENGSGAAGSPMYFARNLATAPSDQTQADLNYAAGQKEIKPGENAKLGHHEPTYNLWIKLGASGDRCIVVASYS